VRLPRFTPLQLFRTRNLLPFAAAALLSVLAAAEGRADPGQAAYARGDFPEAERQWRQAVDARGDDWAAHHNLALALSQQSRWGEAAAHAASAFVQHPRHDSTRWHLALFSERAGVAPGALAAFIAPSTFHSVARALSPAEWQRVLVVCAWTAAVALFCFLFAAYQRAARGVRVVGWTLLGLALLGAVSGGIGVGAYGNAADARAVIIWKPSVLRSIPTEVDTAQKTSPLAAGTIAVADKTFLGWRRLAFENGQTGWVRQEELVPLWK
jgi:tetratricopeptide (TPR) repeat protein